MSSIVDKVKKLLAISNCGSASEAEILNAMTHAQKMIEDYHLSEDDLSHEPIDDYKNVDNAKYCSGRVNLSGKIFLWEKSLASFIEKFTGCKCYLDAMKKTFGGQSRGIMFYGIEEEVELSKELYAELRSIISVMAFGLYGEIYKWNGGLYCQGFVNGLFNQLNKKIETSGTSLISLRRNDLIKYKQKKSSEWLMKTAGIRLSRSGQTSSGAKGDMNSYETGFNHGKEHKVELTRTKKLN